MALIDRQQRLGVVRAIVYLGFLVIFLNLVWMQVLKGGYYRSLSEKNRIRVIFLDGARGDIFDRNGIKVAGSRLRFNCAMIPALAKKRLGSSAQILGSILKQDPKAIESECTRKKLGGAYRTAVVFEDILTQEAMAIEERSDQLPGFYIETHPQRIYYFPEAMAHLLGYIGPITESEIEEMEIDGYTRKDWLGRDGIEKNYEGLIRGHSGGIQMEVDNRGKFLRALGVKEPKEGRDLHLTVDARLQVYVQEILSAHKGAVAAMDLKDGSLLSINSTPSFDPNLFASSRGRKEVGRYLDNNDHVMVNRVIRGQYPAGSIFKIITALSGLENRTLNFNTTYFCPGYVTLGGNRFNCWHEKGHGPQKLTEAFTHSCNVFFYQAGLKAGADNMHNMAVRFGFSRKTGIDLPNEKKGMVPSKTWKFVSRREAWYEGDTANFSIGQGYLQITPLQALVMIAGVATEGRIFSPHLVHKTHGEKESQHFFRQITLPSSQWRLIKEGLLDVVNSPTGTGRLAKIKDVRVSGKTGTAQSGQDKTHAWFVGFAPADKPRVALVVFLENGGRGGVSAASMAGLIFQWLKEAAYI